jgi:hypothetical protein
LFPSLARVLCAAAALWLPSPAHAGPVDELRRAIDLDYSHRDRLHVDWNARFLEFDTRLKAAPSPLEFAKLVSQLLEVARDPHISVRVGESTLPTMVWNPTANYALPLIKRLVPDAISDHRCVSFGHAASGVGYLIIGTWTPECAASAQKALDNLLDQSALIIDVRPNTGGADPLASALAGRFTDKPVTYDYVDTRSGGRFSVKIPRRLEPNPSQRHFAGKLAVLMGPRCLSSNESFLLMMRALGATLVGAPSYGSSGNPQPHRLSNGVTVHLPSWRVYDLAGAPLEGKGIAPDLPVIWPATPTEDVVLRAAIDRLQPPRR